ncbi:MAG: hypothetical protein WD970_01835, partial [Patescibacteria group bacterium]
VIFSSPLGQLLPQKASAAFPDSVQNTLSDSRENVESKHTIIIDQTAGTAFETGEDIVITFPAQFTVPAFGPSDATFSDGTARTILSSCSAGANNVSIGVSGQVVTFTACSGFTSETAGNPISIVLGTGATLATNPANSGIYYMDTNGSYGDDQRGIALAITEGVALSFTIPSPTGNVRFTGDAFPSAFVTILDGGAVAGTTTANSTSFFDKTVTGLSPTNHTFSIFAQAADGRKTITLSFNINVLSGTTITVSGILLPPIITVPSQEKRPVFFPESGLARHNSTVNTFIGGQTSTNDSATSKSSGKWSLKADIILHLGAHTISGLVNDGFGNQSILTTPKNFTILLSADLNIDNLVQLTDFSILMFNYARSNPPNKAADINDNGPVDLVDFSVMMFYWTGG